MTRSVDVAPTLRIVGYVELVVAVAIVAGVYIVVLTPLYVGRRLFLAGRVGLNAWVPFVLVPFYGALVIGTFLLDGIWMAIAASILYGIGVWIAWRIARPLLDDVRAFWQPQPTGQPIPPARRPRGWPLLIALAGAPGFAMLVVIVLISMQGRARP